MAFSATRTWPSPLGAASSSTAWRCCIAAQEVHAPVGAGRVALQHPFDQADGLDVILPVQRRAEPQARHRVGHRHLRDALPLVLAADGLLGGRVPQREVVVHGDANRRQPKPVLAHAVQQLDDEGGVGVRRQRVNACLVVGSRQTYAIRGTARAAGGQQLVGQPAQVLDERELQHARPGPQLADRQRRDLLVAVQELDQLLPIEAAVAVADQLRPRSRRRGPARRARAPASVGSVRE